MSITLDDFKTATEERGVNLIPFPDIRRDATAIADEVQLRKEARYDYKDFEDRKNKMLAEIKNKNKEIEGIRKDMADFVTAHSSGDYVLTPFEDEIREREDAIRENQAEINNLNNEMAGAVDAYDRLYKARGGLREKFDDAKDKLNDALSNPTSYLGGSPSDDDLKKLQDYISVIKSKIESEEEVHKNEEENAKDLSKKYQDLIKKTESS